MSGSTQKLSSLQALPAPKDSASKSTAAASAGSAGAPATVVDPALLSAVGALVDAKLQAFKESKSLSDVVHSLPQPTPAKPKSAGLLSQLGANAGFVAGVEDDAADDKEDISDADTEPDAATATAAAPATPLRNAPRNAPRDALRERIGVSILAQLGSYGGSLRAWVHSVTWSHARNKFE